MNRRRNNQLIQAAARRLEVEARELDASLILLRWEGRSVVVSQTRSPYSTQVARLITQDTFRTREFLARAGFPVVPSCRLRAASELDGPNSRAFVEAHERLVVRPNHGGGGWGVLPVVPRGDALGRAVQKAAQLDPRGEVLIERYLEGDRLRVALVGGRYLACARIAPPVLIGNGELTARQLVTALNADPRRAAQTELALDPLDRIELDTTLQVALATAGLTLDDPVPDGERIALVTAHIEVEDWTARLHPGWVALAERACRGLGADVAGVDLIGPRPAFAEEPGSDPAAAFLGVELCPDLHLHALPTQGDAQPVFEAFVAYALGMPDAPRPMPVVTLDFGGDEA